MCSRGIGQLEQMLLGGSASKGVPLQHPFFHHLQCPNEWYHSLGNDLGMKIMVSFVMIGLVIL